MENIKYNNHQGLLNTDEQTVMFYGLGFKNITEAIKFLKTILPLENTYTGWFYKGTKGLRNMKTEQIYIDTRWVPNEKFAQQLIDLKNVKE